MELFKFVVLLVHIFVITDKFCNGDSLESSVSESYDEEEEIVAGFPANFDFYDKEGKGKFDVADMWEALDEEPNSPGIQDAFNLVDVNGDGFITEKEFSEEAWKHWLLDVMDFGEDMGAETKEEVSKEVSAESPTEDKRNLLRRLRKLLKDYKK